MISYDGYYGYDDGVDLVPAYDLDYDYDYDSLRDYDVDLVYAVSILIDHDFETDSRVYNDHLDELQDDYRES
jgi:hypothetical protein